LKILKMTNEIIGKLALIGALLAGVGVICMMILVGLDVVLRNLMNISIMISDEISGYLLVAFIFFGVTFAMRTGALLRIDFIYSKMRGYFKHIVDIILYVVTLAYTLILLKYSFIFVQNSFNFKTTSNSMLRVPMWIPQSVIVIGLFVLALQISISLIASILTLFKEDNVLQSILSNEEDDGEDQDFGEEAVF